MPERILTLRQQDPQKALHGREGAPVFDLLTFFRWDYPKRIEAAASPRPRPCRKSEQPCREQASFQESELANILVAARYRFFSQGPHIH